MNSRFLAHAWRRCRHWSAFQELYDDRISFTQLERLRGLIDGKRIAIVGNAESLLAGNHGSAIDAQDLVVRLNWGAIRAPQHQGGRTDLLGLSCRMSAKEASQLFRAPPILWLTSRREEMADDLLAIRKQIAVVPVSLWRDLRDQLGKGRPSSGLIAIYVLTTFFQPSKVTLFGFDWKATKTFYYETLSSPRKKRVGPHAWDAEADLVGRWAENNSCLQIVRS